jgi:hypothetical protein
VDAHRDAGVRVAFVQQIEFRTDVVAAKVRKSDRGDVGHELWHLHRRNRFDRGFGGGDDSRRRCRIVAGQHHRHDHRRTAGQSERTHQPRPATTLPIVAFVGINVVNPHVAPRPSSTSSLALG